MFDFREKMTKISSPNQRNYHRISIKLPVELKIGIESNQVELIGETLNISETGSCILTPRSLQVGSLVDIKNILKKPFGDFISQARVVWEVSIENAQIYGLHFHNIEKKFQLKLRDIANVEYKNKTGLLKWVLLIGVPSTFILAGVLQALFPNPPRSTYLLVFFFTIALGRIWETFFNSKEHNPIESSGDWTITAVSFYYVLMMQFMLLEAFLLPKKLNVFSISIGSFLLITSLLLRWWGVKTLGPQWGIHVIDNSKLSILTKKIIIKGPYKYIRHPIYLGVILELIAIPLLVHSYFTLLFVVFVNIPLQILRSKLEEKKCIEDFGNEYIQYLLVTPAFLPKIHG